MNPRSLPQNDGFKDSSERSQIGRSTWSQTCRRRCANSWRCIHIAHMISLDVLMYCRYFSSSHSFLSWFNASQYGTFRDWRASGSCGALAWENSGYFTYAPLTCSQQRYRRNQVASSICTSEKKFELRQTGRIENPTMQTGLNSATLVVCRDSMRLLHIHSTTSSTPPGARVQLGSHLLWTTAHSICASNFWL